MILINGEQISTEEATKLVRMLCEDAKKMAGEFHGMNRSPKFRVNWPNEYRFAESNWRSFIEPTRQMYAARLGDPKTKPAEARMMHLALVLQAQIAEGKETDTRLQIAPGTQQFEGDKHENRKIMEKFGAVPNYRARLLDTAASFETKH